MAAANERMSRTVTQRTRTRAVALVAALTLGVGAVIGGGVASTACTTTTTGNLALVSGIFINTELLIGDLGCGKADTDVYKYVAVVINEARDVGGAGVFDCFAEGVFANMPGTDAGSLNFGVWVYAYNQKQWNEANANGALTDAVALLNGVTGPDGSVTPVPVTSVPDGGTAKHGYPAALSTICLRPATWVTTCSITSQPGVQTLANCGPLSLETAAPSSCALPVRLPDAGPG